MKYLIKNIFSDKLVNAGSFLLLASMITNFFNYIFQITMARLLTPGEYGLMNSLFAIYMIFGIPFSSLLMAIAKQTAEIKASGKLANINELLIYNYKKLIPPSLVVVLLFSMGSPLLKGYLHSYSLVPIFLLGFGIFNSLFSLINIGVLQGIQNFYWLNIGIASAGPLKLFFSLLLVLAGYGVSGAIGGLAMCNLVILALTYLPFYKNRIFISSPQNFYSFSYWSIIPIFFANLSFAIMTQSDMVIVKNLCSDYEAGIYASSSILGKAVMYIPGGIVLALFPMVAESNALKSKSQHLIKKAMIMTTILSGSGALLLFLFPEIIIRIFFGIKYLESAEIVRFFGLAMIPMAFLLIQMNYFLAKGKFFFSLVLAFGAGAEIFFILELYSSPKSIILILFVIGAIISFIGFIFLFYESKREKNMYI